MTGPFRRREVVYLGCIALIFAGCYLLWSQLRANDVRDAASARDRAGLHAESDALKAAVLEFVRQSRRRHDETQSMLREIRDHQGRIERGLARPVPPGGG
jgi:hypothetical protein